ncbi:MAG: Flp pilus assembly complex ATPase component TadA, partial [Deltaproteobacteria bacterium]|nr:Flp pilus assembly complex ATPase component TadA [Deltaproteobacteria bacterium]
SLLAQIEKIDNPEYIKKIVTNLPSGLDFLPTILETSQISPLAPSKINTFFEKVNNLYDFIIIDAQKSFGDALVAIFQNANLITLVATPDDLSIQKLKWCIGIMEGMNLPKTMMKAVLNRFPSQGAMEEQKARQELGIDIIGKIPSDGRTVGLALNRGVACILESPQAQVSKSLMALAAELEKEELYINLSESDRAQIGGQIKSPAKFSVNIGLSRPGTIDSIEIDEYDREINLKKRIHSKLVKKMNLGELSPEALGNKEKTLALRQQASEIIDKLLCQEDKEYVTNEIERKRMTEEIVSEAFGLGALEEYLEDDEISDIMVNSRKQLFIEKKGKLIKTNAKFVSEAQMRSVIDRIIAPLGRRIDESYPMVDARLPDGSRFNAIIPPLSLTGPVLTIRKFGRERPTADDLLNKFKSLNMDMRNFLSSAVKARKNIIVSGGTGSGKTTLLNIVSTFIPDGERIITIEDAAELRINKKHWIRLESRPANIEGKGRIPIRTLFMNSLHMRPDRIIVGECRGPEILDMLQAMNTGHDGSMTTLHANSTKDVLVRMSSMILLAGVDLPMRAIHEMISTALDIVVHVNRFADGSRKIVQITEVVGLNEDHYLDLRDIFRYEQRGTDKDKTILGDYVATGYVPKCYEEFKTIGIELDDKIFKPKAF